MVYFGDRSTGNCVDINQVQIYSQYFKIFQMACIPQPKCNFLHGFFQCQLPVETRCRGENHINTGDAYV